MARSIDSIGLAETGRKFTTELGHNVSLNTLKSIQQSYRAEVKRVGDPTAIKSLEKGAQGRPTMLPGHIDAVIKSLRATGCGAIEGRLKYNLV